MLKKILISIGVVFVVFASIIGYFVYKDLKQEEVLKKEIIDLSNKDLLQDNFNVSVKTTGDYAYVENAIKKFYKELSDSVKKLNYSLNDDELINILSIDNLQSDRPKFIKSHSLLDNAKKQSTEALDKISLLCDEEYIKNLLDKDKVSDYYMNFYQQLMYTESDLKYFKETKESMEELSTNINLFLDKVDEILKMLEKNNDSWFIENGQIYFSSGTLVDEYNNLYKELKAIANDKLNAEKYTGSSKSQASA